MRGSIPDLEPQAHHSFLVVSEDSSRPDSISEAKCPTFDP